MSKRPSIRTFFFCIMVFLCSGTLSASEPEKANSLEQQVAGLWLYTGLITSSGKDLPLNGIFLFKDGAFLQYADYKGEPIKDQGAMAHAGSYTIGKEFVHLAAEQTISTAPTKSPALTSRGRTEHALAVKRSGNELTLVFSEGTGTIQIFELVGPGNGEIYNLENGTLALVDDYFILVSDNENGVDTGYGSYHRENDTITLNVTRWTQANESAAGNLYDISLKGTFDGQSLTLENGKSFQVTH
jgi:hypothetical protein